MKKLYKNKWQKLAGLRGENWWKVLAVGCVVFMTSCQREMVEFGDNFVDDNYTNIILVDTITAEMSTVFLDSVQTSGQGVGWAGRYADPYLGTMTARTFVNMAPPASVQDVANSGAFDSLELILKINRSYYGDTTAVQSLRVNRLTSRITLPEDQTSFYNTSSFPLGDELGTFTYTYRPNTPYDTISIRLSDALGEDLFSLYRAKDTKITEVERFKEYLKGFCISPADNNSGAIVGYDDSVIMRLHYHEDDVFRVDKEIDFSIGTTTEQFSQVTADRTGTELETLSSDNDELVSSQTGNMAFFQPITGIVAKVRFPTIRALLKRDDYVSILNAQLIVKPVLKSFSTSMYPLPSSISMAQTNVVNELLGYLYTTDGSALQDGDLYIDDLYGANTTYTYDVTNYLKAQIAVSMNNENGLMMLPGSSFAGSLNRLIMGDQQHPNSAVQLKLYYISVQPD